MINWEAIQADYEQGLSLRTLATKYDVPKTTIIRHQQAEGWDRTMDRTIERTVDQPQPSPGSVVDLADTMVGKLAIIAKTPLDLREHKLFADALSQYNKILVTNPQQTDVQQGGPIAPELLPYLEESEIATIETLFARAQERKREAEEKITPIRRQA